MHKAGVIDADFVKRVSVRDANIKKYKVDEKVQLDEKDWTAIKRDFPLLLAAFTEQAK